MNIIISGIKEALSAYGNAFSFIFKADVDVMSGKVKRILSDPEDRKVYLEGVEKLMGDSKEDVTVELKDESIVLTAG